MAATTMTIGPLTRVEGHLEIQVTIDKVNGVQQVVDARSAGTMFRGFENILIGRDPRDAIHYTQRICGVCPISHGMAATLAAEAAFGVAPPANGRVIRNLILGANFVMSHILHFYHLAAPDYIDTTGVLDMAPWTPRFVTPDMVKGTTAAALIGDYLTGLAMRRKAHQMGALFSGRMPSTVAFAPGGVTSTPTAANIAAFRALLTELRGFINNTMLPDVLAVAGAFPQYAHIGRGSGNLLAYGVFDLNTAGTQKLLARGRLTNGQLGTVNPAQIREMVKYSWYSPTDGNLNPSVGRTDPQSTKSGAYSWIKAPRYASAVHEVGPLARMWVNGDYRKGISVIDRIAARAYEAKKVADAMDGWLNQLQVGQPTFATSTIPASASSIGLTEAPRGALGHWVQITGSKIARYQVVTPTAWNASPMDDSNHHGAIEQALIGTPVVDMNQPIEVLRVVHSFDPCLSCSVHMARPGRDAEVVVKA
jgi:hydrogenase large subunit